MQNHCRVHIRNLFFDNEFDCAAAEMNRVRDMFCIPFVLFANIDHDHIAAFHFFCRIRRPNLRDVAFRGLY